MKNRNPSRYGVLSWIVRSAALAAALFAAGCNDYYLDMLREKPGQDKENGGQPVYEETLLIVPLKTAYTQDEPIDPAQDLIVYRRGADGAMTRLDAGDVEVSPPSASGAGALAVTVRASGLEERYTVWVGPGRPEYEEALVLIPLKTAYILNERVDRELHLTVYRRGTDGAMTRLDAADFMIDPAGVLTVQGAQTVTVRVKGLPEAAYQIWVAPSYTESLEITPRKFIYTIGDSIEKTRDLAAYLRGSDGMMEPLAASRFNVSLEILNAVGEITVTVTLSDPAMTGVYTVRVYAVDPWTLVYDRNGGAGNMARDYPENGQAHTLPASCSFTRQGCDFAGWSRTRAGPVEYAPGASVPAMAGGETLTLYAKWAVNDGSEGAVVNAAKSGTTLTLTGVDWTPDLAAALSSALDTPGMAVDLGGVGGIGDWHLNTLSANEGRIKSLILPDPVTTLGNNAGTRDDSLSVRYTGLAAVSGAGVTTINKQIFSGCANLKTASFPQAVSLAYHSFELCGLLEEVYMPLLTVIADGAFLSSGLQKADFPLAVTVQANAFYGCDLKTVDLPKATRINAWAFRYCSRLETVNLPQVISLGEYAFGECYNLETVRLPKLTTIQDYYVFKDCRSLRGLYLPATPPALPTDTSRRWLFSLASTDNLPVEYITIYVDANTIDPYIMGAGAWQPGAYVGANGNSAIYGWRHNAVKIVAVR
ncbi:MAG: leucine-rich repeat protein [Treponema sp.]|jgi:hypothetical protein|nr:leucine-rich repeat protein [Treponema sp.]